MERAPSGYTVLLAGPGDLEDVAALLFEFYAELRSRQGWRPHPAEEYRGLAAGYLERDAVFLARAPDGSPAGLARVSEREGSYWVEELYVRPGHRGRGLGSALARRAEEYIAGRDSFAYVMVLPQHRSALQFWARRGYTILNTVELSKPLTGRAPASTRPFPLLSTMLRVYRWAREEYTREEERFLGAVEELLRRGATPREIIGVLAGCLQAVLEGRRGGGEGPGA